MKIIRSIKINFIKLLTSYGFYICIIFTVILCFSAQVYTDYIKNEPYSLIKVLMKFDRETMLTNTDLCSFNIIMKGSRSWLSMFIPIIAAFAFVPLVCDEHDSQSVRCSVFRSSKNSFNSAEFFTACLTGGLAVVIGYVIFAAFVCFTFPNVTEYTPQLQDILKENASYDYQSFNSLGYYGLVIVKFCEIFLYGMISAVPAILCTSIMTNKYLVLCIPFFIKYAVNQTCIKLSSQAWIDNENPNESLAKISGIINPDVVVDLNQYSDDYIYILIYNAVLVLAAYLLYLIILSRRVDCGE